MADFSGKLWPTVPGDAGETLARELGKVHASYKTADEGYRRFRMRLLQGSRPSEYLPAEWIPISAQ